MNKKLGGGMVLFLAVCVHAQTDLVYPLLGQTRSREPEYSTTSLFLGSKPSDSVRHVWLSNHAHVLARDLDYPESLSIADVESDLGVQWPLRVGLLVFALGQVTTQNRMFTSIDNDSLVLKSRMDFSNDKQRILIQYSPAFLPEPFHAKASLMPVFGERSRFWDLSENFDLGASVFMDWEPLEHTCVGLFSSRDYIDKVFRLDVAGFVSQNIWLQQVSVTNAFTAHMRNYLARDRVQVKAQQGLGSATQVRAQAGWEQLRTKAVFPLPEWADVELDALEARLGTTQEFGKTLKLGAGAQGRWLQGLASIKYQRANGSYSTSVRGLDVRGSEYGMDAELEWALRTGHTILPRLAWARRKAWMPNQAQVDPVKYFGSSYGTKRVKARGTCHAFNLESRYRGEFERWGLAPKLGYWLTVWDGNLETMDTWTLEQDTSTCPVKRIHSLDLKLDSWVRIGWGLAAHLYLDQVLPVHVEWETPPLQDTEPTGQGQVRRTIGLFRCGLALIYAVPG